MSVIADAYVAVRPDTKGFGPQVSREVTGALNPATRSSGRFAESFGRNVRRGAIVAGAALITFSALAVKTAAEFDTTMRTMGAVAQVPQEGLEKLRGLAVKLGQDTVFSANEAADAMLGLAKAGVSVADIQGGALQHTLSLATAGNLDLATAATTAANAMNTFGLGGKDMKVVADALAGAANASSADVDTLAQALAQAGTVAAASGLSVQETTAALAAFADKGIQGSDAGTSLKTALLALTGTSGPAREKIQELGLEFFNAQGEAKSLAEIAEELQTNLSDLTQKERTVALKRIFGTDAFRAANILTEEGAEGIEKYLAATSKAGNAAKVAEARMAGFAGALEQLKGSFETVALGVGAAVLPALADLFDGLTPLLNAFGEVAGMLATSFVPIIKILATTLAPIITLIGEVFVDVLRRLMPALKPVIAVLGDALLQVLEAIAPVLPELASAFADLVIAVVPLLPPLIELGAIFLKLFVQIAASRLIFVFKILADVAGILVDAFSAAAPAIGTAIAFIIRAVGFLVDKFFDAIGVIVHLIGALAEKMAFALPENISQGIRDMVSSFDDFHTGVEDSFESAAQDAESWGRRTRDEFVKAEGAARRYRTELAKVAVDAASLAPFSFTVTEPPRTKRPRGRAGNPWG